MSSTHVVLIVDESSSMASLQKATIDGHNEYIDQLKTDVEASELTYVTLIKFNSEVVFAYSDKPLASVPALNTSSYRPSGMTALYDGIGLGTSRIQSKVAPEDKVVIVVITDGYENSSREFNRDQILNLIKEKEAEGNWTFAYLGATADAFQVGTALGFAQGNTGYYAATNQGTASVYTSLASSTHTHRVSNNRGAHDFLSRVGYGEHTHNVDQSDPGYAGSTSGTTGS